MSLAPSAWPAGLLVQIVLEELSIVLIAKGTESAENQVGAVQQHVLNLLINVA